MSAIVRDRIDARRRRRADGGDDRDRQQAGRAILGNRVAQGVGAHPVRAVDRDPPQRLVAEADRDHALVDRRMRLLGAVDAQRGKVAAPGEAAHADLVDGRLAGGEQRVHGRDRRGVVDHAFESRRQADQLAQPAERHGFELRGRRRRAPQHRLLVERRRQELGEDAGRAGRDREVGEEAGMIPVRQAGHEHALEVGHDRRRTVRRLPARWRAARPRCRRASTRDENGIALDVLEVVGDPVDELVAVAPEICGVHARAS